MAGFTFAFLLCVSYSSPFISLLLYFLFLCQIIISNVILIPLLILLLYFQLFSQWLLQVLQYIYMFNLPQLLVSVFYHFTWNIETLTSPQILVSSIPKYFSCILCFLCLYIPCISSYTHHFLPGLLYQPPNISLSLFSLIFSIFLPHCHKSGLSKHNSSGVRIFHLFFIVFMMNSKLLSLAYKFCYNLALTYFGSFLNLSALSHAWFLLHTIITVGIYVLLPRMSLASFSSVLTSYLSFRTTQLKRNHHMELFLTSFLL